MINLQNKAKNLARRTEFWLLVLFALSACALLPRDEFYYDPPLYDVEIIKQFETELETSAYWHLDPVDASGTGITSTGNRCIPGQTLAVDPRFIPLGSKVYFYSLKREYVADDTGSYIKGNRADLAMDSREKCFIYGRRDEKVLVTLPDKYALHVYKPVDIEADNSRKKEVNNND